MGDGNVEHNSPSDPEYEGDSDSECCWVVLALVEN
jgi:hypothetical protein